jgi:CBS domain-containing protein
MLAGPGSTKEGWQVKLVKDILRNKGSEVWSIAPTQSVFEAVRMMADREVGGLVVMEDSRLVGIITERDYARKVILDGRSSRDTPVADVMTRRVLCVSPERTIEECLALMSDKRARHLPVVENKVVVGVVSIGDLVKAIIDEQQVLIDQLQHYIAG